MERMGVKDIRDIKEVKRILIKVFARLIFLNIWMK